MRVKVLLVALGFYGVNYLKEVTEKDFGIDLVGVCDVMPNLKEKFPIIKEKNIPVYKTLDEFYEKGNHADLVVLSTPMHMHYEQVKKCLSEGSNVLCEKPVCTEVSQAEELIDLEAKSDNFVAIGYQLNYSRDVLKLKEDIMAGKLGKPIQMKALHAIKRGMKYYGRNNWAGKKFVNGVKVNDSPFNNACAHQFQVMTYLLGEEIDDAAKTYLIQAECYRANDQVENFDTIAIHAETDKKVPIFYYTTHDLKEQKIGPYCEYQFEKATVYYGKDFGDGPVNDYVVVYKDGTTVNYGKVEKGERLQKLYDAIESVQTSKQISCTIRSALPHLMMVEQIEKLPIVQIKEEDLIINETEDDKFVEIRNVKEIFQECFDACKLPKEIGADW